MHNVISLPKIVELWLKGFRPRPLIFLKYFARPFTRALANEIWGTPGLDAASRTTAPAAPGREGWPSNGTTHASNKDKSRRKGAPHRRQVLEVQGI